MSEGHGLPHVRALVFDQPWYIQESKLHAIAELVEFHARGGRFTAEEIARRIRADEGVDPEDLLDAQSPRRPVVRSSGGTLIIPVHGALTYRTGPLERVSGLTSYQTIRQQFDDAIRDESVKSIVFDIDSPGGQADGLPELAQHVFEARGKKPITAVSNTMTASAAYFLASQADELVITPSGMAGSIGTVIVHQDWSKAYEMAGVKPTIIRAGRYKFEASDLEPLSAEALDHLQEIVDAANDQFVKAVARGRGVTESTVRSKFGDGRMFPARDAVSAGLFDRVGTIDQVLNRHGGSASARPAGRRQEDEIPEVHADEPTGDREVLGRLWRVALARP